MSSDQPPSDNHEPGRSLPPVVPPSGGHIVQLFVVPGAIVLGVVVILLGCTGVSGWFFGFARSPQDCLADMKKDNPDVRWRAANDLAQVLKRDPQLAADPKLGLDLTELLDRALDDLDAESTAFKDQQGQTNPAAPEGTTPANLKSKRKYVQFLSACVGNLTVPVGVGPLTRMALKDSGGDAKTVALLRRHAVWALANLGENRKQFGALPAEKRSQILAVLQEEATSSNLSRSQAARQTLNRLQGTEDFGVIAALAKCAAADDPDLRTLTAFALGFWTGSPAENALAEQTLLKLSGPGEHGQGERILLDRDD